KRKIGLLSFKVYIPHDRDISLLREARVLFQLYVERYPDGEWVGDAHRRAEQLLTKEGMHELEIASFYLRKNNPLAAIKRAGRILGGEFPEKIKDDARGLIRDAEESIPQEESVQDL
ncbi:MAG: outer membrane protein assembly factor BamD, partial [bacterium]